jgi:hypothetical protein
MTASSTPTFTRVPTATPLASYTLTQTPASSATLEAPATQSPAAVSRASYIYPSPTKGETATLVYWLSQDCAVTIKIYNQIGRLVVTLQDAKAAGRQTTIVSVGRFAPGIYYYVLCLKLSTGAFEMQAPHKFVVLHLNF